MKSTPSVIAAAVFPVKGGKIPFILKTDWKKTSAISWTELMTFFSLGTRLQLQCAYSPSPALEERCLLFFNSWNNNSGSREHISYAVYVVW
jgi:hypothetical protein